MDNALHVRISGPLVPYACGFQEELARLGYTAGSAAQQLRVMALLSRWLADRELDAGGITAEGVAQFLQERRARGNLHWRSSRALVPLLEFLARLEVFPVSPATIPTKTEELLERYSRFLVSERGLAPETIRRCYRSASVFLAAQESRGPLDLKSLSAADISQFMLGECAGRGVGSAKNMAVRLRSFLRFLYFDEITAICLSGAVPNVSGWRGSSLPRVIDSQAARRLLDSCDRSTSVGRRDFAVLTLLVRLGLRAGEVAKLKLTDLDWRAGEILIRAKRGRLDRLPLPVDVGEAIADYLQDGRPKTKVRSLFLRVLPPKVALSASGITEIVHAGCRRAGLAPVGAHRIRHSAASEMLARGAGLPEIGQVLRHRSIATTGIYAKVDAKSLYELARPWPGGVQ